jgi:hypothetical protein
MTTDTGPSGHTPEVTAAILAITSGDLAALEHLLATNPDLATRHIADERGTARTLLHVATDWPGRFPNNAATLRLLIAAGADVNAGCRGPHEETPLHWAASTDDVELIDVLLDAGADIEAGGATIGSGTALADATAFAQWKAARRLIERGARSTLFESASLGLIDRLEVALSTDPGLHDHVSAAFWGACHGGQLAAARWLLARGADPAFVAPWDAVSSLEAARRSSATDVVTWLEETLGQR